MKTNPDRIKQPPTQPVQAGVGISFEYQSPKLTTTYVCMKGIICETGVINSYCPTKTDYELTKADIAIMLQRRFNCTVIDESLP